MSALLNGVARPPQATILKPPLADPPPHLSIASAAAATCMHTLSSNKEVNDTEEGNR